MKIHGFNKTTLLDYPKHLACTVFLSGCNYRCPFCHNASLVINDGLDDVISEDDFFNHLKKRINVIEGVCITGGEPTIYKDLPEFIYGIKELGFKVKLDTNGNNPKMIYYLLDNGLLDYIAMDIKNAKNKYDCSIGIKDFDITNVCETVKIIMNSDIEYEFRTTVVKELHTKQDFINIGHWLKGARAYYLQPFKDSDNVILKGLTSYEKNELIIFKEILEEFIEIVDIRALD